MASLDEETWEEMAERVSKENNRIMQQEETERKLRQDNQTFSSSNYSTGVAGIIVLCLLAFTETGRSIVKIIGFAFKVIEIIVISSLAFLALTIFYWVVLYPASRILMFFRNKFFIHWNWYLKLESWCVKLLYGMIKTIGWIISFPFVHLDLTITTGAILLYFLYKK